MTPVIWGRLLQNFYCIRLEAGMVGLREGCLSCMRRLEGLVACGRCSACQEHKDSGLLPETR